MRYSSPHGDSCLPVKSVYTKYEPLFVFWSLTCSATQAQVVAFVKDKITDHSEPSVIPGVRLFYPGFHPCYTVSTVDSGYFYSLLAELLYSVA